MRRILTALYVAAMAALVVVLVLLLPVLVPTALLLHWRHRARLRRAARNTRCESCGAVLGLEALRLADAEWSARLAEIRRNSDSRVARRRIVRSLHAICPNCGSRYSFLEKEGELRPATGRV